MSDLSEAIAKLEPTWNDADDSETVWNLALRAAASLAQQREGELKMQLTEAIGLCDATAAWEMIINTAAGRSQRLAELVKRCEELERLNLEAQHRIADLCVIVGNIEQCRAVEGDSVTILCDNPEADSIET